MLAHFEKGEKCDGSKIWNNVHKMPEEFENGRKLDGKSSLQDFDTTATYLCLKNRSASFQKRQKCSTFIIFECSHDSVFKMGPLEFRFRIYRFRNLPAKTVPFSSEREAYRSNLFHRF